MLRKRVLAGHGTHLLANDIRMATLPKSPSVINRCICRCVILGATAVQEGSRRLAQIRVKGNLGWVHKDPTVAMEDSISGSIASDMDRMTAIVGDFSAQTVISRLLSVLWPSNSAAENESPRHKFG